MFRLVAVVSIFCVTVFFAGLVVAENGGGAVAAVGKHCNSEELQGLSCTNPGNCYNACAFYCSTRQACYQCCTAFPPQSGARQSCQAECDKIPWES